MPGFPRGPIDPQVKATRGAVYLLVGERKVNTADLSPMIKESHATRDRIGIASSPGAEPYRYEILKGWSRSKRSVVVEVLYYLSSQELVIDRWLQRFMVAKCRL